MTGKTDPRRGTSIFWSSVIGFGLLLGLLWSLTPRMAVEAKNASPGSIVPVLFEGSRRPSTGSWATSVAPPVAPAVDGISARSPKAPLLTPPMPGTADLAIGITTDRVWGVVGPGETVTVAVNGVQMGAARADDIGFFWTTLYDTAGNRPRLGAGDTVTIYRDGIEETGLMLRAITGTIDVVNNVVAGTIGDVTSPISVTVYRGGGEEPMMTSLSQTVSTDSPGNYSVAFGGVWDFFADDRVMVSYVENGVGVHRHIYADRMVVLPTPANTVVGWTTPGAGVTVTVFLSDAMTTKAQTTLVTDGDTGRYSVSSDELGDDIQQSDIVVVEIEGGTVMSREVDTLDFAIDATSDRIIGQTKAGAIVRGWTDNLTPLGKRSVYTTTLADPTGAFTLEFGTVADLMPGQWVGVYVADADGDDLVRWFPSPSIEVNQTWNEVTGNGPSPIGSLSDGRLVTLTLYSAASDTTFVRTTTMNEWAWYGFEEEEDNLPDIAPGDVVTVESEGYAWQGVVRVQTMTVGYDLNADQFAGAVETPTDRVEISGGYYQGELYPLGASFDILVTATSPFIAAPVGFDVDYSLPYEVVHRTAGDYVERISRRTDMFGVRVSDNAVVGTLNPPGIPFTITLRDSGGGMKAQMTGTSNEPIGEIGGQDFWWSNERIEAGDRVQMQSAAGFSRTVVIPDLQASWDLDTDIVTGQGSPNSRLQVYVDNQGYGAVPADDTGQFVVAVDQLQETSGDGDLVWGDNIYVETVDEHRTWVYERFAWPFIVAHYDTGGWNNVWGEYAIEGNAVNVIVTHPISGDIATGTAIPGACSWCRPNQYELDLPDDTLTPGVTVTVDFGDGFVDSVTVLDIDAEADADTDVVTVTAPISTIVYMNADNPLHGWWDSSEQVIGASGYVTFDLGADGYDIIPGTDFNVHSRQHHDHNTQYSFRLAAPDLRVDKWNLGNYARPGGVQVYSIYYTNEGDGVAENVLIVETLPLSLTYADDTSGIMPDIGVGGVITWDLGALAPGDEGAFMVTLDVPGDMPTGSGVITSNCAFITTPTPESDPDDNEQCTGPMDVWEDDVELGVDKWVFPSDPTPGQELVYTIQWCNNRGAAAGPVWLTDTLPLSTTLVGWEPDVWWRRFWVELSATGEQLALYAPGLPGDTCHELYVTLLLDADVPISTTLENDVVLYTPGELETWNNERTNSDAHVDEPRYDIRIDKDWHAGQHTPGGWVNYSYCYANDGNMETYVQITDTLPAGLSFDHVDWGVSPTIDGDKLIWDWGPVAVGENECFHPQMNIDGGVAPGTTLTNCVVVGIDGDEDWPDDNSDCASVLVNNPGPNLRVTKSHWWNSEGQLGYSLLFVNIGDQAIYDFWITDSLPISTTWGGWWSLDFDDERLITYTESSTMLRWKFSELYPGDSGGLDFDANLDEPGILMRWYTNTVEISTPPGDVDPEDNRFEDGAFSGEAQLEVFVEDPEGNPVSAWVELWNDWSGYYGWDASSLEIPAQFGDLEPGDYWVRAWPLVSYRPALANSDIEPVTIGERLTGHTLTVQIPNVIGVVETPEGDPLPTAYLPDGNPASYPAAVEFHNSDWSTDLRVATNITGEFGLNLPDDDYELRAYPDWQTNLGLTYTKSAWQAFSLPGAPTPLDLGEIRLNYPRVWGTVVTPKGARVSTWVNLWSDDYGDGDDTYWYGQGSWDNKFFSFGGLPEGHYYLRAEPPWTNPEGHGFSNIYEFDVLSSEPLTTTEQVTLVLQAANFVGDLLYPNDIPAGAIGCPGCPVQWMNARVRNEDGSHEEWATTGEDGRFAFSGLGAGVYTVEVFLQDYMLIHWAPPDPVTFTVTEPDERDTRTLYLQPPVLNKHVAGAVVYDDGSPVLDADADGTGDALVYAYHEGSGQSAATTTDPSDGSYQLDLRGGRWRLGVEPAQPNVDWSFEGSAQWVEFSNDETLPETWPVPLVFTVTRSSYFSVTGRVEVPGGAPPAAGTVQVDLCTDEGGCFGGPVRSDGSFSFRALPGIYQVWIRVTAGTGYGPPADNGRLVIVDEDPENIGTFQLRARTAHVSGRVIISSTGQGLEGVLMEAWTDEGDWSTAQTISTGNYIVNLVPGHWHGGPVLSADQERTYAVWPPQRQHGYLKAGETAPNVNFFLRPRDAAIQGRVVDETDTTLTGLDAVVFAKRCTGSECWTVSESAVQGGTFELRVVGGYTYTVDIWLPTGRYIPGPDVPVEVFVGAWETRSGVKIGLLKAGTRIWGEVHDGATGDIVEVEASVFGRDPGGRWVEDSLWPGKQPYTYTLFVPTPTPATGNITWTLGLWVDPSTGYIADPAKPRYQVVIEPGREAVWQPLRVKKLDTEIIGTVTAGGAQVPFVWVFADGVAGTDSEELYFEARTDAHGIYTMPVLPGDYLVGAYQPLHLSDDFFPPEMKEWTSEADNPVDLVFRSKAGEEFEISGALSVSPIGTLPADEQVFVFGVSVDGHSSVVTGTIGDDYHLPVVANTTWYVWAAYEDPAKDRYFVSPERVVKVRSADVPGVNLELVLSQYVLPDPECTTVEPSKFSRLSFPAWDDLPSPLLEIQAGTMPVEGTVQVCVTPRVAVPGMRRFIGFVYEVEARDSTGNTITENFKKKVRLIFYFTPEQIPVRLMSDEIGSTSASASDIGLTAALEVVYYSTARQEWVSLDDVFVDPEDWFATGKINHFSRMGVRASGDVAGEVYLPIVLRNHSG